MTMDPRRYQFLAEVVGVDGARALAKTSERSPDLEWAVLPRAVMAWVEVMGVSDYSGEVPGVDIRLAFKKSETGYSGRIDVGDEPYVFADVSSHHVAAAIVVALGGDGDRCPSLRDPKLAKLGKAIDVLVASRTERALAKAAPRAPSGKRVSLPGQAAAPLGPKAPTPPTPTQVGNVGQAGAADTLPGKETPPETVPGTGAVKLPKVKKKPAIKVTKSQAATACSVCGGHQFTGDDFTGCACFADLAKSADAKVIATGYKLEFGAAWDADALATLIESLGK